MQVSQLFVEKDRNKEFRTTALGRMTYYTVMCLYVRIDDPVRSKMVQASG